MPWDTKDVSGKTKKATTASSKRQWTHVANSILSKTGDEGRAIREANAVVKKNKSLRDHVSEAYDKHA